MSNSSPPHYFSLFSVFPPISPLILSFSLQWDSWEGEEVVSCYYYDADPPADGMPPMPTVVDFTKKTIPPPPPMSKKDRKKWESSGVNIPADMGGYATFAPPALRTRSRRALSKEQKAKRTARRSHQKKSYSDARERGLSHDDAMMASTVPPPVDALGMPLGPDYGDGMDYSPAPPGSDDASYMSNGNMDMYWSAPVWEKPKHLPVEYSIWIYWPSGLSEKAQSPAGGRRQLMEKMGHYAESPCPAGPGKCQSGVLKLKVVSGTADHARLGNTAPVPIHSICNNTDGSCSYDQYMAYSVATGGMTTAMLPPESLHYMDPANIDPATGDFTTYMPPTPAAGKRWMEKRMHP